MSEWRRLIWPLLALGLLLLFNALFYRSFFHVEMRNGQAYGTMVDVLNRGAPVMLLSLGMSLVIATGGIDLSVGAVMAIAGAFAACLLRRPDDSVVSIINVHGSAVLVIALSLGVALLAGAWNGMLVVALRLQPIVATLILMVAGRGIAQLFTNGQIVTFEDGPFTTIAHGRFLTLPLPVTIAVVAAVMIGALSRWTGLGLFIESVGSNPTASRLAGLPAGVVKLAVYSVSGVCAGLAGLIVTADGLAADSANVGLNLELDAILAVSMGGALLSGGRFSLIGSLIGAILLQSLTITIEAHNVRPAWNLVIKGGVVVGVCLLQSQVFRDKLKRVASLLRSPAPSASAPSAAA